MYSAHIKKNLIFLFMKTTQAKYLEEHGEKFGSGQVLEIIKINPKEGKAQQKNVKTWKMLHQYKLFLAFTSVKNVSNTSYRPQ